SAHDLSRTNSGSYDFGGTHTRPDNLRRADTGSNDLGGTDARSNDLVTTGAGAHNLVSRRSGTIHTANMNRLLNVAGFLLVASKRRGPESSSRQERTHN